jgi:transposase InsO family protein
MYSYEERMRAVELNIRLGKRVRATIRELGYPTKNALKGWHREYEHGQDLAIRSVPRPPKFSEAQKQVALAHYGSQRRCISWTLRALGYPGRATLTAWVREAFPDADLANTMLDAAVETIVDSEARPIIHSDCGGHYRWPGWLERIKATKLVRSMSRKASSQDNAACEGFFGRLKAEFFYPRDWRAFTAAQFFDEVDAYIRGYNLTRIKMSLGGRSPNEYRESLGLMP